MEFCGKTAADQDVAAVEFFRQLLDNEAGGILPEQHFPEPGQSAAIDCIVGLVEGQDAESGRIEHRSAQYPGAVSDQYIQVQGLYPADVFVRIEIDMAARGYARRYMQRAGDDVAEIERLEMIPVMDVPFEQRVFDAGKQKKEDLSEQEQQALGADRIDGFCNLSLVDLGAALNDQVRDDDVVLPLPPFGNFISLFRRVKRIDNQADSELGKQTFHTCSPA